MTNIETGGDKTTNSENEAARKELLDRNIKAVAELSGENGRAATWQLRLDDKLTEIAHVLEGKELPSDDQMREVFAFAHRIGELMDGIKTLAMTEVVARQKKNDL